jgi:hypothetical protein
MAITTDDLLVAALGADRSVDFLKAAQTAKAAGRLCSFWLTAGYPGAGAAPSIGLNGQAVNQTFAGTFPYTDPSGANTGYAGRFGATSALVGHLMLYDRLWQNSGIAATTTTAQAITPAALPARDNNGSTNGDGVQLFLEAYGLSGAGGAIANTTISYTNSAGTAGRTATITPDWPAAAPAGHLSAFTLQSGDTGVRSVQSITLGTSYVSGAVGIVLARKIASLDFATVGVGDFKSYYDLGRKLYAGFAGWLVGMANGTSLGPVMGMFQPIEG